MKKNRTTRLVVLVLFLAIVTAVIISGTFAKYTTSGSGTATATVAKWNVALTANGEAFTDSTTFTLADTYTNVAEGKIAPGTSGDFNVAVNATGSEVAVEYTVTIEMVSDASTVPANMVFYKGEGDAKEVISFTDSAYTFTGTIALADVDTEVSIPMSWDWPYYTSEADDAEDTDNGANPTEMKFKVTLTATQAQPVASTTQE